MTDDPDTFDDRGVTSSQDTIRRESGRFLPGTSGNPGGRSPTRLSDGRSMRDIARDHTDTAIEVLVKTMSDTQAPAAAKVSAAVAVLDRGWGKPAQFVETVNLGPVSTMSDVDRGARLAAIMAAAASRLASSEGG